ncbi:heme biosynthesis HemY N-terminal domain-containing protein [Azospira restricta]|uniref:Heme biosynthesis protein HemY n=1 Tax=Azospira restricta TaxID=404405 RepID=A0A974SRC3_9RHOO|nr:heme biosynthesis HemY N-terminal domain-containing protein [Azospira restricta]QRJ65052.1 heme biosynthesis protein HemY [Azospira restricta]
MRGLFWVLSLFALAVGLSMAARFNDGYLLLVLPPWRMEVSLNLAVAVLLAGFVLLYLILRGIALTLALPGRVRQFRERRRQAKAAAIFQEAVRLLFEGRFGHALKRAGEAHAAGEAPGLSALIAARAAQRMRESGKQQQWLERATADDARTEAARLMLEAEMCLDERRFEDAVAVLARLQQLHGRHIAALRLELRAQQGCGQWDEVLRIVRLLEKRDALRGELARELKLKAHQQNLVRRCGDLARLRAYLDRVPAAELGGRVVQAAAQALDALGAHEDARRQLERQLEREWDAALVECYGRGDGDAAELTARLARAEDWLQRHPREAALLVALGRLCARLQLWGKAQSYLEASLSIADTRDAHLELARLADALGREGEANRHYRLAAGLPAAA